MVGCFDEWMDDGWLVGGQMELHLTVFWRVAPGIRTLEHSTRKKNRCVLARHVFIIQICSLTNGQQIFIEHLLCSRQWGYRKEQNRQPCPYGAYRPQINRGKYPHSMLEGCGEKPLQGEGHGRWGRVWRQHLMKWVPACKSQREETYSVFEETSTWMNGRRKWTVGWPGP